VVDEEVVVDDDDDDDDDGSGDRALGWIGIECARLRRRRVRGRRATTT
jgi:hypothetical protein